MSVGATGRTTDDKHNRHKVVLGVVVLHIHQLKTPDPLRRISVVEGEKGSWKVGLSMPE